MGKEIFITKASGRSVPFSKEKLLQSLKRAGATEKLASGIANEVSGQVYGGMTTKKIYRLAFNLLRDRSSHLAARYHLKKAIMELGPSGYPFERFIGEILRYQGYSIRIGEIVKGKCVNHEIDVIAEKDQHHFMVECKYHNHPGTISEVKIPLYIQARFKDVEAAWITLPGHGTKFHQGWVVTNTRFTGDAIQYGTCAGLKMISWDYPGKDSLKGLIDDMGLYPLTCLTTLTKQEKRILLENKIVLCKELCHNPQLLEKMGMRNNRISAVLEEANQLCEHLIQNARH